MGALRRIQWLFFGGLILTVPTTTAHAEECKLNHNLPGSGSPYYAPDSRAGYASFNFLQPERPIRLVMRGDFPKARQINVTVYDDQGVQHDWLTDADIVPESGSLNPFQRGVAIDTPKRAFRVEFASSGKGTNHVELPSTRIVSIWFRYYDLRNDADAFAEDFVPKMFAYDQETGEPTACPLAADPSEGQEVGKETYDAYLQMIRLTRPLDFFKYGGATFFSNPDNDYLFALPLVANGDVLAVRFKAPTFFDDRRPNATFSNAAEVRYWSYCTTDLKTSYACLADRELVKDRNGFVTIVVGDAKALSFAQKIPGVNVLAKPADAGLMMNYIRQLAVAPDFDGRFAKVEPAEQATAETLGVYVPGGTRCTMAALRLNVCGLGRPPMP